MGCEELDRLCCCLVPDKYPRMNLNQDFYQHGLEGMSISTSSDCNYTVDNDNLVSRRRIFLLDLDDFELLLVSVRRVVLTYSIPPVDTKDLVV